MNALDLLLIGGFLGLLLGAKIMSRRPEVIVSSYPEDRRTGGCAELLVGLLLVALLGLLMVVAGG
jgi:hypothetical protein